MPTSRVMIAWLHQGAPSDPRSPNSTNGHRVPEVSGGFAGVQHRDDVGMLKLRRQPDLPKEPFRPELAGKLWVRHLERDMAIVLEVAGEVHGRHTATSQLTFKPVPTR
jgi:hypothetical protein